MLIQMVQIITQNSLTELIKIKVNIEKSNILDIHEIF